MATEKLSDYVVNPTVKGNESYINFLNDKTAFEQIERDYVAGSIDPVNPVSVKDANGNYTNAFNDYVSLIINNPSAIQALNSKAKETRTARIGNTNSREKEIPTIVAGANETNATSGLKDYIVKSMKEADPSLATKTDAQILSIGAQKGILPLITKGYVNTQTNAADYANNLNVTTTLSEPFANYLVEQMKKDNPALVKNLTDAQIIENLEMRQGGAVFQQYANSFTAQNPTLKTHNTDNNPQTITLKQTEAVKPTETQTSVPSTVSTTTANEKIDPTVTQAVSNPTNLDSVGAANRTTGKDAKPQKTYASLGIDKSLTSNIATDYARRSSGDMSKDEKETFRQAMVQASLLKSVQSKTKGATLTKEDFIAMASTPAEKAMAAQVFDNASGGKNTISEYMAQDLVEGGLVETVRDAVKNGEITTTTMEQKQQIKIA
jgi:hypothetical protein